jgi:hypothetical protein
MLNSLVNKMTPLTLTRKVIICLTIFSMLLGCGGGAGVPYSVYNFPTVDDLSDLGNSAKAIKLIQITEKIFRTYKFKDIGARYPTENIDPVIESYAGGVCDSAAAAFIRLTSSYFDSYQADVVFPQDGIGLGAHSFVYVPAGDNHIIVDLVYGLIFVGPGSNPKVAFNNNKYKKYKVGIKPDDFEKKLGYADEIYKNSTDERFSVALPNEFIKATFGLFPVNHEFETFDTKGSGFVLSDLSMMPPSGDPIAATYFVNIGNYYRKTIQEYLFYFNESTHVRIKYQLHKATTNPFYIRLDINSQYLKSSSLNTLVPNECMSLSLNFVAQPGTNSVKLVNEDSMGYRGLQKFTVQMVSMSDPQYSRDSSFFYDDCH